jgi:hypothetical protein
MRCYFEKDENAAWRHYRFSKMYKSDDNWFWRDNKIGWLEEDFRKLYKFIWSSIKPVGNFIFILTSLIEQTIIYRAKKELDTEIINIYDEFFQAGGGGKVIESDIINISCSISNSIYNKSIDNIFYFIKLNNISNNIYILPHDNTTTQNTDKVINDNTTSDIKYINGNTTTSEPDKPIYINGNTTNNDFIFSSEPPTTEEPEPRKVKRIKLPANEPKYINEVTTKSVFICPADGQTCENCTCGATAGKIGDKPCSYLMEEKQII